MPNASALSRAEIQICCQQTRNNTITHIHAICHNEAGVRLGMASACGLQRRNLCTYGTGACTVAIFYIAPSPSHTNIARYLPHLPPPRPPSHTNIARCLPHLPPSPLIHTHCGLVVESQDTGLHRWGADNLRGHRI